MKPRSDRPVVLVIDDDQKLCDGLRRRLTGDEFTLIFAHSGAEGLSIIRGLVVAVVICDEWMPGESGVSILEKIRKISPRTTRMLLTGAPTMSIALEAINSAGIYRFFTKPCSTQELGSAIRSGIELFKLSLATSRRSNRMGSMTGTVYELPDEESDLDPDGIELDDEEDES